jgi:hypothetical protein
MNNNGISYRGFATHDPEEAAKKYFEMFRKRPKIILIRPSYPVTKDHPLLLETEFCGQNIMMVSNEIDVIGYKELFEQKELIRKHRKILDIKRAMSVAASEDALGDGDDVDSKMLKYQSAEAIAQKEWKKIKKERPKVMSDKDYLKLYKKPGYVYLLSSDNGFQKIGRSIDVEDRRVQLERDIPVNIVIEHYFATKYYIEAESHMHEKFDKYRVKYEWFKLKKEQVDDIKAVNDYELDGKLEKSLLSRR